MNMKKRILALLLALTVFLGLAACGGDTQADSAGTASDAGTAVDTAQDTDTAAEDAPSEETGGTVETLTIAITKDENTLAPFTYVSSTGLTVNRLIYDTLFTIDLENNVVPWMVELSLIHI